MRLKILSAFLLTIMLEPLTFTLPHTYYKESMKRVH